MTDKPEQDVVPDPKEAERDTGEEERESQEEDAREASPNGMTRMKTERI